MAMFIRDEYFELENKKYLMCYGPLLEGKFVIKVAEMTGHINDKSERRHDWIIDRSFELKDHNNSLQGLMRHLSQTITKIMDNHAYLVSCTRDYPIEQSSWLRDSKLDAYRGFTYTPEEVGTAMVICKGESLRAASDMAKFLSNETTKVSIAERRAISEV